MPAILRRWTGTAWEDVAPSNMMTTDTTQTISGTKTFTGSVTVGANFTLANPGVGAESVVNFAKGSDAASIRVIENTADSTHYGFVMSDNPDGTSDAFAWRIVDWQNPGSGWSPLYMTNIETTFNNRSTVFNGNVTVNNGGYVTSNNGNHSGRDFLRTTTPTKSAGSGTITLTVDASSYTAAGGAMWVKLDTATTFSWGTGTSTNAAVQTGLAITTTDTTLSNGVRVRFSAATGGVAGDTWTMRLYPGGNLTAYDVIATGEFIAPRGSATNTTYSFSNNANTGMWSPAADQLGFATGGTSRVTLTTTAETHTLPATFNSTLTGTGVYDGANRVYSAVSPPPYPVSTVNGRAGAVSGLAEANAVVDLTTAQTIGGVKTFTSTPAGTGITSLAEQLRSNAVMTGGGTLTTSSSAEVRWTTRLIVIASGNGTHFSTSGYFDIAMPANGTVISGAGGAANATVTTGGVPLGSWQSLYYILPIGSSNGSLNANFRIVAYTGALEVPPNWVLVAARNDESSTVRWGNGVIQDFGDSINLDNGLGRAQFVTLTDTQTIAGTKTFSSAPVVPDSSFGVTKLSATGTRDSTTFLRGDGTWGVPIGGVTSVNSKTGAVTLNAADVGAVATTAAGAANGVATLDANGKLLASQTPAIAISDTFVVASQAAMLALTAQVGDIAVRTDTNTTYILRVDGAATLANWELLRTPTDAVTSVNGRTGAVTGLAEANAVVDLTNAQTIAGVKTFSASPVVPDSSFGIAKISATGTRDATTYLSGAGTFTTPAAPSNMVSTDGAQTISAVKTFTAIPVFPASTVTLANISATGTRDATTYLRGDGTWQVVDVAGTVKTATAGLDLNVQTEPPAAPSVGDLWVDSDDVAPPIIDPTTYRRSFMLMGA